MSVPRPTQTLPRFSCKWLGRGHRRQAIESRVSVKKCEGCGRSTCEPLGGKNGAAIVAALNRHKGFLRGEMGHRIAIKFTPDLRFVEDLSFAEAQKIETILNSPEVQRDLAAPNEEQEED